MVLPMHIARPLFLSAVVALSAACGGGESTGGGDGKTAAGAHPLVGSPAPDFTIESQNGLGKFSIAENKGKVIVVDFWATWCEPCKKSFPKLQELNAKYKSQGVEVVGVSEDDEKTGIKDFGSSHGAKFPLGWDTDKKIAGKWEPKSMPASFVVDKKGIIRFAHLGYHDGDEAEVEKEIKELL